MPLPPHTSAQARRVPALLTLVAAASVLTGCPAPPAFIVAPPCRTDCARAGAWAMTPDELNAELPDYDRFTVRLREGGTLNTAALVLSADSLYYGREHVGVSLAHVQGLVLRHRPSAGDRLIVTGVLGGLFGLIGLSANVAAGSDAAQTARGSGFSLAFGASLGFLISSGDRYPRVPVTFEGF